MKKQASAFWETVKQPTVIVCVLGLIGGGFGGVFKLLDSNAKAQAEIKVREKYDKVLTDYAVLMATCDTDH